MALSFLTGAGSSNSAKFFDIRLDDEYIVFRGNEEEAASAHLRGKLVLCLSERLTTKHIRLTLTGVSKVANRNSTSSSKKSAKERTFFEKTWTFRDAGKNKTETLEADNYEYPFDIVLEGSLPESVEGLSDSFVMYRFKAEIGRRISKDIVIRKPLRIIRTLDSSALELAHAMTVANVWPNKIEYSISTPSKAVIYGTSVSVEFRLVSLLKGLKIGNITTQVVETQEFNLNPEAVSTFLNHHRTSRVVADDEYTVPEDPEILDEEAEGYKFSRHLELPKSLTKCMQDAETRGIKIRHKLKFNVLLHNPDDHTSELRATLPVSLYISPSLALNENNELVDQTPVAARRAIETDISHAVPPLYRDHQLDQMYSDVDFSGYSTPGNFSIPSTPFGSHSRNLSSENLSSLDTVMPGGTEVPSSSITSGDVSAAALRHRLQNLRSRPAPPTPESLPEPGPDSLRRPLATNSVHQGDYFSRGCSSRRSHSRSSPTRSRSVTPGQDRSSLVSEDNFSRRTSDEDYITMPTGTQTPGPQYLEVEYLSRIPSYSTAVRASARTPYSGSDLPTYDAATSLSASPNAASVLAEQASSSRGRGPIAGIPGPGTSSPRGGSLLFTTGNPHEPGRTGRNGMSGNMHERTMGEIQDEERRLRLMQARGRG
ncbi:hypothetical protein EPUS_08326 [Endocarpon pusillum Z07020]|uniref:Carbon catabolite repressor D n=1 Tax=Endocarpon pusillum (strain Z07020 / HMAS-L-300199) TaxID=1263415 RepID=U1GD38_ENDPU|nr:uncharacterized protein EPUS_08326 [Endocarpon pusillum Z07020]ERF75512.1 hypothetical protein EPUS_08326 [Endocarpon pusillum Z07020]